MIETLKANEIRNTLETSHVTPKIPGVKEKTHHLTNEGNLDVSDEYFLTLITGKIHFMLARYNIQINRFGKRRSMFGNSGNSPSSNRRVKVNVSNPCFGTRLGSINKSWKPACNPQIRSR